MNTIISNMPASENAKLKDSNGKAGFFPFKRKFCETIRWAGCGSSTMAMKQLAMLF